MHTGMNGHSHLYVLSGSKVLAVKALRTRPERQNSLCSGLGLETQERRMLARQPPPMWRLSSWESRDSRGASARARIPHLSSAPAALPNGWLFLRVPQRCGDNGSSQTGWSQLCFDERHFKPKPATVTSPRPRGCGGSPCSRETRRHDSRSRSRKSSESSIVIGSGRIQDGGFATVGHPDGISEVEVEPFFLKKIK